MPYFLFIVFLGFGWKRKLHRLLNVTLRRFERHCDVSITEVVEERDDVSDASRQADVNGH